MNTANLSRLQTLHAAAAMTAKLAENMLREERDLVFPEGSYVRVTHERYKGLGVVSWGGPTALVGCPSNKLSVTLGNGNTWWYEIETCLPASASDRMLVSRELSRVKRQAVKSMNQRRRKLQKANADLAKAA